MHYYYHHRMATVTFGQRLRCERCEHEWNARSERKPVSAPVRHAWDSHAQQKGGTRPRIRSVRELAAFGMWADRPETDEELLEQLRRGWGDAETE
jgi:hypothetical protein